MAEETRPQQASAWEDFVDIFLSPGELFRRRANAGFGMAFLVLAIVSIVLYYAFPSVSHAFAEAQITASLAKNPQRAAAVQARGGDPAAGWKFFGAFVPVGLFVAILVMAFLTWVASKIASVALSFKQAMMLNTWVAYIFMIQTLLISVLAMFKVNRGEALDAIKDRSVGVLRFMDTATTPGWLVGLLSRLDVFAIWQLVLTAVAVMAITKTSKGNAYIVAAIVWLVGALPIMLAAAFS
jgi:hypothetical protein